MKSGFLLGSQHMPHLISLFLFISTNQTREFTSTSSTLLGKELCDWRAGPRIALGHSFGLCGQASPIMYPKGFHCVFWFITLLEEIGQLLLWKRRWESNTCKMCFISKPVAYRQHEFRRSNLEGNFKHITESGVSRKGFSLACGSEGSLVTFLATYGDSRCQHP